MWQREMADTRRGKFEIFTRGEGSPLCITHFYSEFNERGYYFADAFTGHFKVYLINLKEAGKSCKADSERELGMEETCKDLESVRGALGIEKWGFAGHSAGGMLGLVYAAIFPRSLTKILIGGASASKDYMKHEGSMYSPKSPLNKRLKALFSILKSPSSAKEERAKAMREWTEMSLYRPEKFEDYFSRPSSGRVVQKRLDYFSFHELPNYDIREKLKHVPVPAFIYCGKYDAQCPLPFSEEIHRLLPDSKLFVFNQSNHVPFLEEEDLFKEMVRQFAELGNA